MRAFFRHLSWELRVRKRYSQLERLRKVLRIVHEAEYRSLIRLRIFHGEAVHQIVNSSGMDRYPEIFAACRGYLSTRDAPLRILSFGCATGEEVFTLRRYFPEAELIGVDINPWNLKIGRQRNSDSKIHFMKPENLHKFGEFFDAIFCMAVLQRSENNQPDVSNCWRSYPFDKFEEQVYRLDGMLSVGGLLIIEHTNYRFCDVGFSNRFSVIPLDSDYLNNKSRTVHFDRTGKRLSDQRYGEIIFEKNAGRDLGD